jgi:hypothetical protein
MIPRLKELKRIVCRCRPDHRFMCRVYIRVAFPHFSSLRSSRRTQNKRLHQLAQNKSLAFGISTSFTALRNRVVPASKFKC